MSRITSLVILLAITQTGCIAIGGYSSGGGWFIWPGGLGLIVLLVVLYLLVGRKR